MSEIFGSGIGALESSMRFRVARQSALAANVANADTPAYRRVDLVRDREFAAVLGDQVAVGNTTHDRHIGAGAERYQVERGDPGDRPDRNGVDLDQELLELSRNAGAFQEQAEVLSRLLTLRRIAVTGEAR